MIQRLKKYLTIRSYVRRLSQELERRFDRRPIYTVEQVTQAAQRGGFSVAFIAYAHAAFCSLEDFNAYYQRLGVAYGYQELRRTIARRYLSGQLDFDAETIIYKFRRGDCSRSEFYESGIGTDHS
jgi:hypothetical protein